ncbi:hypothetical protein E3N88_09371 [Mikania micrantha]|uniref:Integrase catalytic domain-containing protein n=1 Tax=Mikania micrantha TaxID=192012 RepID=A0A5N6PLY0_9ASTR|nr:hypothetical protein E3N88_09371 [Mikania micrantha]
MEVADLSGVVLSGYGSDPITIDGNSGNTATNLPLLPTPLLKPMPITARRLSHKEIEEKRAKGERFGCSEKYTPAHQCKNKQLFSIELIEEEDVIPQDDNEALPPIQEPYISLNAIMGVYSFSTMRVKGSIGTKPLHILIGSGSTRYFMNLDLTLKMKCPIKLVEYLGYIISGHGVQIDPKTVASSKGLGAVLIQEGHPLAFISKALSIKQQSLSKITTPLQQTRLAKLMGYTYEIAYKKGSENLVADGLSKVSGLALFSVGISSIDLMLFTRIKSSWDNDVQVQELILKCQQGKAPTHVSWNGEVLLRKNKLWVGNDDQLKKDILYLFHSSPTGAKYEPVASPGLLQPLPVPTHIFTDISMDFVSGLLKVKGKDTILVVVDRLTKYAPFIPLSHPYGASQVALAFLDTVFKLHGCPQTIVSDRDPIFLSQFWKEFMRLQGVQLAHSTAYHPQTDGQTEVLNCCLETYLRSEASFLMEIVDTIYNKLDHKEVHLPLNMTGMWTRYKEINSWLDQHNLEFLAIYGMGGSGKTTLAKYIYDSVWKTFEYASFVEDIGGRCKEHNDLLEVQKQLLKDILGGKKRKIPSVSRGTCMIEEALETKRVLIVLDDIFGHNQCQKYEMRLLNYDESLELLSRHAFGSKISISGFEELVLQAVQYCEGNPLALEVLGSSLFKKNTIPNWISQLNLLEKDIDARIQSVLIRSYMLPFTSEKELFMHIACFFIGKDMDYVIKILDPDYSAMSGIKTLVDRCLLSVSPNKKLMMHRLLQEMGRNIV